MKLVKFFLVLTIATLLQGCVGGTSPESRYYRMTSLLDDAEQLPLLLRQHEFLVGVGPLTLASYLDRPQIIGRSTANTLQLSEFDRWSGSLQDNLKIILTENLTAQLGADKVISHPWPRAVNTDYHITLRVSRFDTANNTIVLRVNWLILGNSDQQLLKLGTSEINEPVLNDGYDSIVIAQSRAMRQLSVELLVALQEILGEK